MGTVVDVSEKECCVCLEDFKDGDDVTVLDCNASHVICTECVDRWNARFGRMSCPLCRQRVEVLQLCRAATFFKGSGSVVDPIRID